VWANSSMDSQDILTFEPYIRLSAFFGVFFIMALLERLAPRRTLTVSRKLRWCSNLGIVVVNTIIARLILPMTLVVFATLCAAQNWGVLNLIDGPMWGEAALAILVMDFAIWLQHVMVHAVPLLWRLHRLHHTDLDYDVTTGARFHPLEILLSLGLKFLVIALLGASPVSVMAFEVILNAMAMFNHANVRLPLALDGVLRWLVVTPDFHRVHHSVHPFETNSNFGFNLSIWDRVFGTYIAQPEHGHTGMTIGLNIFRNPREERLDKMLTQPFRSGAEDRKDGYTINRRDGKA